MTKFKVYRNHNGQIVKYVVKGHAGYDDYGKDIVCAAVSVLAQTGINALESICKIDVKYKEADGYLSVAIPENLNSLVRQNAEIILQTVIVGIQGIIDSYPEYVTLEYGEV